MAFDLLSPERTIAVLHRLCFDQSPANIKFIAEMDRITASVEGIHKFANDFCSENFYALGISKISHQLMYGFGLLPNTVLESALTDYLATVGKGNTGIVALQIDAILSNLERATGELAIYSAPAILWNQEIQAALDYSLNPQNVKASPSEILVVEDLVSEQLNLRSQISALDIVGISANFNIVSF